MENTAVAYDVHLAVRFAIALALGILLGLERERSQLNADGNSIFAGARTLALISLLGAVSGFVHQRFDAPWFVVMVFAGLVLLLVSSYTVTALQGHMGMTTEVTTLLAFVLGAMAIWGWVDLAVAICIMSLLLLSIKRSLRSFVHQIHSEDIEATLKFAVITAIVLPLLPNQSFGPEPLNVINPYKIWLMVVLISGLNFMSYILIKVVGAEHGIGLTGFLGGLVSSTAVTLGFSQRSQTGQDSPAALSQGILLSWTVMFVRLVVVVTLLNPPLGLRILPIVGAMAVLNLLICLWLWWRSRSSEKAQVASGHNPFELMEAMKFGLLFGVVTFIAKAAEVYFGNLGLYLASAIAGLTDVDVIALSMTELAKKNTTMLDEAATAILIAMIANTIFKSTLVISTGSAGLRREFLPWAALLLCSACAMLALL